jgi:hypothetical protein
MHIGVNVKYQLFLLHFNKTIFWHVLEKYSKPNFMKIRPVGAELFRADRRTYIKLMVAFLNFAKAHVKAKENKGGGMWKGKWDNGIKE